MVFCISVLFTVFASARKHDMAREKFHKDNDPVHYMRELEFRNTIDQYDLAIVMFFKKDSDDCKRIMPGFRYAAHKATGKADFISVSAKTAPDLVDELGVDSFPTIFTFRNGHLIDKLPNTTHPKDIWHYIKNVTAHRYAYIHEPQEAKSLCTVTNATLIVALPLIDARMDKLLSVISTKFMKKCKVVVATTPELAAAFSITKFPSITMLRIQDDTNITFPGEPLKATVKSLTDFVESTMQSRYELMPSFRLAVQDNSMFFAAIFDFGNENQKAEVHEVLEKVANEHAGAFPIRYGDEGQLRWNLSMLLLQNRTLPIYGFFKNESFSYRKWLFDGKATPLSVAAFCADQLRGRNTETIVESEISEKSKSPLLLLSGAELKSQLEKYNDKDFVVNFVGYPCHNCESVDELFHETATWTRQKGIRHVLFARVNASCNDIPMQVWRNETYPYAWMFPGKNRSGAFPIGKRRHLYWMIQLLVDNSTHPIKVDMPPKPAKTPMIKKEDL